jgi:hypothetical protein
MRQSKASQLAAAYRSTTQQHAQASPIIAFVILDGIIVVFVPVAKDMRQSQTAHLAAAQHSTAQQQAECLPIVALVIFHVGIVIVTLAKQVCQQEATGPAFTQQSTAEQQPKRSSFLAFGHGFVHNPFSFHSFTPLFLVS